MASKRPLTLTREGSWQPLCVSCGRPESLSSPHRRHDCTIRFLTSSPKHSRQSMHVADFKFCRLCYLAWKCFILLRQLKGECEWRWVAVQDSGTGHGRCMWISRSLQLGVSPCLTLQESETDASRNPRCLFVQFLLPSLCGGISLSMRLMLSMDPLIPACVLRCKT